MVCITIKKLQKIIYMPPILFVAISLQSVMFLMLCSGHVKVGMVIAVHSFTSSGVADKNDDIVF